MSGDLKVFLSHSHSDRHFVTKLQGVLEKQGAETFLDQDHLVAGEPLSERIQKGINWCDTFLLIWSSSAAISDWVEKELNLAWDLRKRIIPYSFDKALLPNELQNFIRVEANDREHGDANLLEAVFGPDFENKDATTPFPGKWHASVDVFGMAKASYDLELRKNGQVQGKGSISNSGIIEGIAHEVGMSGLLNTQIPFHRSKSFQGC